jgi:hypothetical protein
MLRTIFCFIQTKKYFTNNIMPAFYHFRLHRSTNFHIHMNLCFAIALAQIFLLFSAKGQNNKVRQTCTNFFSNFPSLSTLRTLLRLGNMARKQCFLVCPPSGNMARKQCFLVCPPSGNMARKQCFLVYPPSGNVARKQCFLVCPPSGNMARKQCFLVCPPSGNMAWKQCFLVFPPSGNSYETMFSGLSTFRKHG